MTKTPDEIKKGMECCSTPRKEEPCRQCPYAPNNGYCVDKMSRDAFYLIQQLQAENADQAGTIEYLKAEIEEYEESADKCCYESKCNAELNKLEALCKRLMDENEQLEAERDAAVADILYAASVYLGECNTCKNGEICAACKRQDACDECPNSKCMCSGCGAGRSNWQWRGVQKEE